MDPRRTPRGPIHCGDVPNWQVGAHDDGFLQTLYHLFTLRQCPIQLPQEYSPSWLRPAQLRGWPDWPRAWERSSAVVTEASARGR
jgi:hypothetical protein